MKTLVALLALCLLSTGCVTVRKHVEPGTTPYACPQGMTGPRPAKEANQALAECAHLSDNVRNQEFCLATKGFVVGVCYK